MGSLRGALAAGGIAVLLSGCVSSSPGGSTSTPATVTPPSSMVTAPLPPTTTASTIPASVTVDPYLPSALPRHEIPWERVSTGWYVVLFDSSKANPTSASDFREGPVVLYLVDIEGNRYEVHAWPPSDRGGSLVDAVGTSALVVGVGPTVDDSKYELIDLVTGTRTAVYTSSFPENSYTWDWQVSLTRPTGANLVVHRSDGVTEWLERRAPDGSVLATLFEQPYVDSPGSLRSMYGHDGTFLLVTHHDGVALVSNDGALLGRIEVPTDTRCDPVRWWDADTFLAACYGQSLTSAPANDSGEPHTFYGRLWLLETDGSVGAAVTEFPPDPPIVVDFGYNDAWPTETGTFLQWTGDCGASLVELLQPDGTGARLPISTPALAGGGMELVDVVGEKLTIYGWQDCASSVGALVTTDLTGTYLEDLVPVVGDARSVIGVRGLTTTYP